MQELMAAQPAFKYILKYLNKFYGYEWRHLIPVNFNRYLIVLGDINLLLVYKRELFQSFGQIFRQVGESGVGETINSASLSDAIRSNVKYILTIFPDSYIYFIDINDFLRNSHNWTTKEGVPVRSSNIHLFTRLNTINLKGVFQEGKKNGISQFGEVKCV